MTFAKKAALALATTTLALTPVMASAAPVRAEATMTEESQLRGGSGTIILVAVIAGFAYALYELISDDDNENPVSPG